MFETHLTVRLPDRLRGSLRDGAGDGDGLLSRWAREHGMKYARIVLERGLTPQQPMLTYRGSGTLDAQLSLAQERVRMLRREGWETARAKIEAAPGNADIPQNAEEAGALPPECYFEHHVKLVLADEADLDALRQFGARYAAHLSRNARRTVSGGRHERFLTQRARRVGHPEAGRRLEALLAGLDQVGHRPVEVEREFVVHDSNPSLDDGWAEA
jgi:hypothetical protein